MFGWIPPNNELHLDASPPQTNILKSSKMSHKNPKEEPNCCPFEELDYVVLKPSNKQFNTCESHVRIKFLDRCNLDHLEIQLV